MDLGNAVRRVERTGRGSGAEGGLAGRAESAVRPVRPVDCVLPRGRGRAAGSAAVGRAVHGRRAAGVRRESVSSGGQRVVGAYVSGARAQALRTVDRSGAPVLPSGSGAAAPAPLTRGVRGCGSAGRRSSTIGGPCVPVRRVRLGRGDRPGGARRLAGEVRAGLADRVLATVAVALGSTTVVVVLGLLADLAAAR
ncbi:hypothetical protein [Pseudonocardia xishanensis]|uniref:Uncharacterized protein n=1 Tax=Pseudonocardia xishanensis TaxID=630995 RepID=A0ABP8RX74_9PSEU